MAGGDRLPLQPEARRRGLPRELPAHGRICFAGFAPEDLPLPADFEMIFDIDRPERAWPARGLITACTQQWGKPLDIVPRGWKTICLVTFPEGVPDIIDAMPVVDTWHLSSIRLGLRGRSEYPEIATA